MAWQDLETDLAEMFGDFSYRQDAVDERLEYRRALYLQRCERERDRQRAKRGSTRLSIERRRRIYATQYEQTELFEMTKILKSSGATGAARASSVFHVASSGGKMALCGAVPHGMFLLEPVEARRATCPTCISAAAPSAKFCRHCGREP